MSSQLPGLQQGNEGSLDTETMHTRTYIMHACTRTRTTYRSEEWSDSSCSEAQEAPRGSALAQTPEQGGDSKAKPSRVRPVCQGRRARQSEDAALWPFGSVQGHGEHGRRSVCGSAQGAVPVSVGVSGRPGCVSQPRARKCLCLSDGGISDAASEGGSCSTGPCVDEPPRRGGRGSSRLRSGCVCAWSVGRCAGQCAVTAG